LEEIMDVRSSSVLNRQERGKGKFPCYDAEAGRLCHQVMMKPRDGAESGPHSGPW